MVNHLLDDGEDCGGGTPTSGGRLRRTLVTTGWMLVGLYLVLIVAAIVVYKAAFIDAVVIDPVFGVYGLVVCAYLLSRFAVSLGYRPPAPTTARPTVAVVMPAFNEEAEVAASLEALLAADYPIDRLQIVAIDDGSTDGTLAAMRRVEERAGGALRVIAFPENRGKRAAMVAGVRATDAEIVAFVDSDSRLDPDAIARIVDGFADTRVGAVCGHAEVLNVRESWLTRMQAVRYFVAFRVVKAAESVFGAVTCCSGCFSAYRRTEIAPHLEWWETQRFLGRPSMVGDDRALTNRVLRRRRVLYHSGAVSRTAVPVSFRAFMRQQTRWKRSWTRESLLAMRFIWRKHPAAALATYVGVALPLMAPVVAVRALLWNPLVSGLGAPWIYLLGIYAMALVYALYYAVSKRSLDPVWLFGVLFVFFYLAVMVWQTYYAILTSRSARWGTRPATAGLPQAVEEGAAA